MNSKIKLSKEKREEMISKIKKLFFRRKGRRIRRFSLWNDFRFYYRRAIK